MGECTGRAGQASELTLKYRGWKEVSTCINEKKKLGEYTGQVNILNLSTLQMLHIDVDAIYRRAG